MSGESYRENSQAVQAHLAISQSVIQRMAANSASCKAWCIAMVSAILVIVADKGKPQYTMFALIPTALFFALDTYYLSLERMFRKSYNDFIGKLHHGRIVSSDLYAMEPHGGTMLRAVPACLASFSIWPFYGTLIVMILLAKRII